MRDLAAQLSSCPLCQKALTAAVDMLQVRKEEKLITTGPF